MPTAEEFDEFYVSTRRDLILQTFALTGDLAASRTAVRDSYVAARHHWDKVGTSGDPMGWVRPRAWSRAQARHTISPWHRERHIDAEQAATLEALHRLRDAQRRVLVLAVLTDLSIAEIGREIALPVPRIEDHLATAMEIVTEALDCPEDGVATRLRELTHAVDTVKLPRPTIIRRNGLRRRRNFALTGSVAIAAVVVAAGSFVTVGSPESPASAAAPKVIKQTKTTLLSESQIAALAPGQTWRKPVTSQNDDQDSSGLNTACQQQRYADKSGDGALVRTFTTTAAPRRALVQTVEISKSAVEAEDAYRTTRSWYSACRAPRIQLLRTYEITQVGNQAQVLLLEGSRPRDPSYAVGLARTGSLTVSVVLEVNVRNQVPVGALTATLATSVRNLCSLPTADQCVGQVLSSRTRPPTGEVPGMLTSVDLPVISTVQAMWDETPPTPPVPNEAANTPCDKADFAKAGATSPLSRSFLLSNDNAPKIFGVTQTYGRFASAKAADRFVDRIIAKMASCEKRILSSTIESAVTRTTNTKTPYAYWRLMNQTQNRDEFTYWMGISRVGPYVSQVTMTPVGRYDVAGATFAALILRSRDRLYELP